MILINYDTYKDKKGENSALNVFLSERREKTIKKQFKVGAFCFPLLKVNILMFLNKKINYPIIIFVYKYKWQEN